MLNVVKYITRCKSTITYGAETWEFNKHLESKLMSMEMDVFRRSARCLRLEKIRNNVIREKMNINNSVSNYVRYKLLTWYVMY